MTAQTSLDLGRIVMPLVRLLAQDEFSWSDRESIAAAIQNSVRIHRDMTVEQRHLNSSTALQKAIQGGIK